MPRVSTWFVRASLCYLIGGFTIGALLLTSKGVDLVRVPVSLRGAHIEMLLVGWLIQLVMGVAIWIFPRFALRRTPDRSAVTAWLALVLLNIGIALVCLGGTWIAIGRVVEIGAAASFGLHLWGRVAPGLSEM